MHKRTILPLFLLLLLPALWATPLRAAESRTITLLPVNGVALEVPYPEGYMSVPQGSPDFTAMEESMRAMAPMIRVLAVFHLDGPEEVPGKALVICGYEAQIQMTPLGFQAMKGVFKNMDWGLEARQAAEAAGLPDPITDPAMVGVFAEADAYIAAMALVPPKQKGEPFIPTVVLSVIFDGKLLNIYFCEPMTAPPVPAVLKVEARHYLKALEADGRLGFR